jgi:signal transduction histidine kinase
MLTNIDGLREKVNMMKTTILVVEDDVNLMHGIRDILQLQDYSVITADNGLSALDILRNCPSLPDLIVSDIMMPEMNGYEFFEAVRLEKNWTAIPFMFLTAKGEKSDIRAGMSIGADDYVTKPFAAEELIDAVEARLRRHKELQVLRDTQVNDVKRNIMTILNHEFRTPLTYVVAYADMLNRDAETLGYDEIKMFLQGVNAGADRLRRLIENFILLVELETGESERTYNWRKHRLSDYRDIVKQAVGHVATYAAEKGVEIFVQPMPPNLPTIEGDSEYLKVALSRLLENAVKFSDKPNSTVHVAVYNDDNYLHIEATDQGRGIPEHEFENIFEPFYQIDRETNEDQGAGAGLTIVKHIAELHHGTVEVYSVVGKGSQFKICIPPIQ